MWEVVINPPNPRCGHDSIGIPILASISHPLLTRRSGTGGFYRRPDLFHYGREYVYRHMFLLSVV